MKKLKKAISTVCIVVLTASIFAGCVGTKEKGSTPNSKQVTTGQPMQLKIISPFGAVEVPSDDNPIQKKLEEYTNSKLDITWLSKIGIEDKVNALINSGEFPDLILFSDEKKNQGYMNAFKQGVFWEVGPYLKEYKNLSRMNSVALQNCAIDGKVYGLSRSRQMARSAVMYRKDWADALGIKVPQTQDDLYNMLKAFTYDDPDKDGKNNTIGYYVASKGFMNCINNFFMSMFGAPYVWGDVDGKAVPSFMTKEFKEGLKFMRRMCAEKLMNQDFPVAQGATASGLELHKIGTYMGYITSIANTTPPDVQKLDPKATFEIIPKLNGEKKYAISPGYLGLWCIPKQKVKTEVEMKQILGFFDKLCDKEMQDLMTYGIQGTHYNLENGKAVFTDEGLKKWNSVDSNFHEFLLLDDQITPEKRLPLVEKANQIQAENSKDVINNITYTMTSPTFLEKGAELNKIWEDAVIRYVLGDIDEKGYDAEIEKWKNKGGNKVIEEYTVENTKTKKK